MDHLRGILAFFVGSLLLSHLALADSRASRNHIIPAPQRYEARSSQFKITAQTRIILGGGTTSEDEFTAGQINEGLKTHRDLSLRVVREQSMRRLSDNFIFVGSPGSEMGRELLRNRHAKFLPSMREEGYFLGVDSSGIVILGETARGRFYGVMSLIQMIERVKKTIFVRGASIHDWPLQKMRGVTDDISRGQISTLENFKKIIRFLSRYKLNTYCLYIEDMFLFTKHPLIGTNRGASMARDVKELDRYARQHHVELIPIFQTLGHWENILAMPQYVQYAEFPGAHTLNLADERIYKLLDEMIGEVAQAFSSPFFHIGADEIADVGLGGTKKLVERSNLISVYLNHYKRVFSIVKKYKKKPMMYGDMLLENPDILPQLPKDVVVVDWQYDARPDFSSPRLFRQSSIPFVVSPAIRNYTGPFPNYLHTLVNIRNFAEQGFRAGSMGLLTSNWNDFGGEALRELNYYGYAWTAECAWQPTNADVVGFNKRFFAGFFGNEEVARTGQLVYALLSEPYNLFNWHELWRHPMLPPRSTSPNILIRVQSVESTMPLVDELLFDLSRESTENKEHVEDLRFITDLNLWFAQKMKRAEQIKLMIQDSAVGKKDSIAKVASALCESVLHRLDSLKERFKTLWLRTNRPEGLELLMKRYERQASYWREKKEELDRGILWSEPTIASQWIYHPRANPFSADTAAVQIPYALFRRELNLPELPSRGVIQVIAGTHAKVWVNGVEIGEVSARRSLSLIVETKRVQVWDVTSFLRQGANAIAVEARNYNRGGSAGFNLYGEITINDSTFTLLSDSTWTVSDSPPSGWNQGTFLTQPSVQAVAKLYPLTVIKPNFKTGRSSWIEQ